MSWDLVLRHCGAIQAQIELLRVQALALEDYAKQQIEREQTGQARIELADRCHKEKPEDCGRQSEDAVIEMGGMGGSEIQRMCRGCGLDPRVK